MNQPNMSLPSDEFIISVINSKYNKTFTLKQLYLSERVNTTEYDCESMVKLHASASGPFTGTRRAFYNRVPLDEFLEGRYLEVPYEQYFDTDDMIEEVLLQLGINLDRSDVISDIVDYEQRDAKIRISSRSSTYTGHVPVYFTGHPDSLGSRVPNNELNGFDNNNIQ